VVWDCWKSPRRLNVDGCLKFLNEVLSELLEEIFLAIRGKMWYRHDWWCTASLPSKRRSGNSWILNRFLGHVVLHCKRWQVFRATSSMFHSMLLLTITVFLLCWFKPLLSSESVAGTILSSLYKFYQRFMMKLKKRKP
jgi:hypothetical protein